MKKEKYVLIKKANKQEIFYIDYEKIDGYEITPKNKVKYDGITVNKLILIKPSFTKKLLIKKTKRRLDQYLQYIIEFMDEDDTTPDSVKKALDSLEKYKRTIINKYRMYLDEKYYMLLLQKMELIEQELNKKMYLVSYKTFEDNMQEKLEKEGKTR